jgi:hypothetical protein
MTPTSFAAPLDVKHLEHARSEQRFSLVIAVMATAVAISIRYSSHFESVL